MSGWKDSLKFMISPFKQNGDKSTDKSTKDKQGPIVKLDRSTELNIKLISDNLIKLNNALSQIYTSIMGTPINPKEKAPKKPSEDTKKPTSKKEEKTEGKLSQQKQKEISKGQKKVKKKLEEDPDDLGKGLAKIGKLAKEVTNTISSAFSELTKNISKSLTESVDLASKYITSSSITVDKDFRSMQLGMGLSNQGALSLKGSMDKLHIDKSDLAYLTQGQREALTELNSMFNELYDIVDMSAISELGNAIYMMQAKMGVVVDAFKTNVVNLLTSLTPVIEFITDVLDKVFDAINDIFSSPEMKNLMTTITEIAEELIDVIEPIIDDILAILQPLLGMLVTFISNILKSIMPTIKVLGELISKILSVLSEVLGPVLGVVAKVLVSIGNILSEVMTFLEPILEMLLDSLGGLIEALVPVLNTIISVISAVLTLINNILKPIITIVANILSAVVDAISSILSFFQPLFDAITKLLDEIMPVINVIGDLASKIFNVFMQLFKVIFSDLIQTLKPLIELITETIVRGFKFLKPILKVMAWFLSVFYSIYAVMYNAIIAIRNAVVWWDKKDYLNPALTDVNLEIDAKNDMTVDANSGIASTYAGANNTSSISNSVRETSVTATFNQTISGTASSYAQTLQKQNYESNQVLAELLEGAL